MTTGAEPKKIAILAVLLVGAGIALYTNVFSGDSASPVPAPRAAVPAPVNLNVAPESAGRLPDTRRANSNSRGGGSTEIKFRVGPARPEERVDPTTIDPTLRLDLLAKVQNVEPDASMRNLFQYGAAPPPAAAPGALVKLPAHPPTIQIGRNPGPVLPPKAQGPPPPPSAPPIALKYYGYKISRDDGRKQAFLLDGDDIIIASENEEVKKGRYKVISIGLTSITIEDTQFKSTQTLKIQPEAVGA